jgi:uncharacterized protein
MKCGRRRCRTARRKSPAPFLLFLFAAVVQQGCGELLETANLHIDGNNLEVEIARTADEQAAGLMHRNTLPPDRGMLFVYDRDKKLTFWMKNTSIPLSIAFVSADGIIKEIYDMKPFSLNRISSRHSVRYALEVNQGYFEEYGISVGDQVEFPDRF